MLITLPRWWKKADRDGFSTLSTGFSTPGWGNCGITLCINGPPAGLQGEKGQKICTFVAVDGGDKPPGFVVYYIRIPGPRPSWSVSSSSTRSTRGNSRARQLPNASVSPCVSPSTKFQAKP